MSCQNVKNINNRVEESYLIEAHELKLILNDKDIKVLDFRRKDDYDKGHLEGAFHLWRTDIIDTSFPFDGVMASKTQVEALFSKFGIKNSDTIIVYDDNGLCEASRLWWILQNYDFKNIKMLHGGLTAWQNIGGQLTKYVPKLNASKFKLSDHPSMKYYVSKAVVKAVLNDGMMILDTRSSDEYEGLEQKKGASKAGRLPNSVHIDWAEAINYNGDMRLKSLEDLENIYNKLNIKKEDPIIVYCHSGVRSAHTTFVLTQLLGYRNVRNYDGSWTEWSNDKDLPFEKHKTLIKN